jgi:hypothetical protein
LRFADDVVLIAENEEDLGSMMRDVFQESMKSYQTLELLNLWWMVKNSHQSKTTSTWNKSSHLKTLSENKSKPEFQKYGGGPTMGLQYFSKVSFHCISRRNSLTLVCCKFLLTAHKLGRSRRKI